jgi:hypothetical protein
MSFSFSEPMVNPTDIQREFEAIQKNYNDKMGKLGK